MFRNLKDNEIRIVTPTLIELHAEEGWIIAEKSDLTKITEFVYLPNEKYINDYVCVEYKDEEQL